MNYPCYVLRCVTRRQVGSLPLLQLGTPFSRQEDKKPVSPSTQGRKAFPGSSKMDDSGKATNENIAYPLLVLALPLVV